MAILFWAWRIRICGVYLFIIDYYNLLTNLLYFIFELISSQVQRKIFY